MIADYKIKVSAHIHEKDYQFILGIDATLKGIRSSLWRQ